MTGNLCSLAITLSLLINKTLSVVSSELKKYEERSCESDTVKQMQRKVQLIKEDCGAICAVSDMSSYKGKPGTFRYHKVYKILS